MLLTVEIIFVLVFLFSSNLTIAWQRIATSKMPVSITYNVAYKTLLFLAVTSLFSNTANAQEQIIVVNVTNTECLIKATWSSSGALLLLSMGI